MIGQSNVRNRRRDMTNKSKGAKGGDNGKNVDPPVVDLSWTRQQDPTIIVMRGPTRRWSIFDDTKTHLARICVERTSVVWGWYKTTWGARKALYIPAPSRLSEVALVLSSWGSWAQHMQTLRRTERKPVAAHNDDDHRSGVAGTAGQSGNPNLVITTGKRLANCQNNTSRISFFREYHPFAATCRRKRLDPAFVQRPRSL